MTTNTTSCLICGAPLQYQDIAEEMPVPSAAEHFPAMHTVKTVILSVMGVMQHLPLRSSGISV
mgnify:CR=1 FL=1